MTSANRNLPASQAGEVNALDALIDYTVRENETGVRQLVNKHGFHPDYHRNLHRFAAHFLQQGGEAALDEFLEAHPDRELLRVPGLAPAPVSSFTGGVPPTPFAQQLLALAYDRRAAVVDAVNRHGSALLYDASAAQVAERALTLLGAGNGVLARELAGLAAEPAGFFQAWQQNAGLKLSNYTGPAAALPTAPTAPRSVDWLTALLAVLLLAGLVILIHHLDHN